MTRCRRVPRQAPNLQVVFGGAADVRCGSMLSKKA
jgi:hypothetical protein